MVEAERQLMFDKRFPAMPISGRAFSAFDGRRTLGPHRGPLAFRTFAIGVATRRWPSSIGAQPNGLRPTSVR